MISIVLAALLIYFLIVFFSSMSLADLSIGTIEKDRTYLVWIALLVIIPLYVASMFIKYCLDGIRRDLTHIVFVIVVGFVISVLITVTHEWYPSVPATSSVSFKNMSVSVERPSPYIIPIKSVIYPGAYHKSLIVKIYNYSSIDPVSVSMSVPSNVYFDYSNFKFKGYDSETRSFQYISNISTIHSGQVFNSTAEYLINIDYRNMPILQKHDNGTAKMAAKSSTQINSSILAKLNITDITSTRPLNRFNTIDNDLNTTWSADGNGQSITYLFDKGYNVSKIGIAFFKGDVRQNHFEINKENFTSSGRTLKLENFTLKTPLINTKSLQIIGRGNSGGGDSKLTYNAFSEIRIYGPNPKSPPAVVKPDNKIYHNSVPFSWSVRMTDLSLTTYFWIIMAGVVTSRFMSLILGRTEEHEGHKNERAFQIIEWKDGLGILFSFIIAVILFSSFSQQLSSLTIMILFNISIAFAFGFGFDKTLEVAPRFSPHYVVNRRNDQSNQDGQQEQPEGNEN